MSIRANRKRFILEATDPTTECIVIDVAFEVENLQDLRAIVDAQATDEDLQRGYDLNHKEVQQIRETFGIKFDPGSLRASLRSAQRIDELPYKVHTNRELAMMLAGTKPLAYFTDIYPGSSDFALPEHLFDPYVADGRFVKKVFIVSAREAAGSSGTIQQTRFVAYALKREEWRIEAFTLLQRIARKYGWDDGLERMLGSLLGYEDWQTDAFLEHTKHLCERRGSERPKS